MDQLHLLLLLSFSMLIGAFFSGTVPMAFKLSETKSRLLALMGSGILVGTALAIIIPEGIDSIYSKPVVITPSHNNSQTNSIIIPQEPVPLWEIGISLISGFVLMLLIDQFSIYQSGGEALHNHHGVSAQRHEYSLANQDDLDANNEVIDGNESVGNNDDDLETTSSETRPIRDTDTHRVTIRGSNLTNSRSTRNQYYNNANDDDDGDKETCYQNYSTTRSNTKVTPTLGLVIHAAADGIALGAAATTSHRDVEMIIFLAIMLHKAPAAFSLVVFLLHRGLKHSTIRRHLLAFSLSAPLAAIITYFGLSQSGKEALQQNNATGIAMLFSAGTFLYVATVHVMPELVHNKLLSFKELIFLVGGSFLPLLLAQLV